MLGFCVNAAVPPLHAWLPDAYAEATVTGSVFMCAFTTKTAVYALCRGFAGLEILVPSGRHHGPLRRRLRHARERRRRLLAYHIICQVGYMVAGVGLGTAMAINGACAHAFAHILYKGLLFMGAGAVLHMTGKAKLTRAGRAVQADALDVRLYADRRLVASPPSRSSRVRQQVHDRHRRGRGPPHLARASGWSSPRSARSCSVGIKLPYFIWFGKSPTRGSALQADPARTCTRHGHRRRSSASSSAC